MIKNKVLFNKPTTVGKEIRNINELNYFSSNGKYSKRCSSWLKKNLKCKDALLVNSCTAALEMCAILINIKPKDEVIMPSYTFVSTANAFALRGAIPVYVDINHDNLCLEPDNIVRAITKKTRAIVVVHYAGISPDMDKIIRIAKKYKLFVIEDAAHALLSSYKKKPLGSIGDLATLSFHETKNIHCGEGGALLINNSKFIKRAQIIKNKGTNRHLFNKKIIRKYSWVDIGSSYSLNEINAAFLYEQLKHAKKITKYRIMLHNLYNSYLEKLELKGFIKRPVIPSYSRHNGHIYYLKILNNQRSNLINYLKLKNIYAVFHYVPLHSSIFGKKISKTKISMKNTDNISQNLLRLPLYLNLSKKEVKRVCKSISNFFNLKQN